MADSTPFYDDPVEWTLIVHRTFHPWWGLGLVRRTLDISLIHTGTEEEILARAADLKAKHPSWDFQLRRGSG
jgi:hypothetical protein